MKNLLKQLTKKLVEKMLKNPFVAYNNIYQFNAPWRHSKIKPKPNNNKKNNIVKNPLIPKTDKQIAHGNKNAISKSNIINNIAIK